MSSDLTRMLPGRRQNNWIKAAVSSYSVMVHPQADIHEEVLVTGVVKDLIQVSVVQLDDRHHRIAQDAHRNILRRRAERNSLDASNWAPR